MPPAAKVADCERVLQTDELLAGTRVPVISRLHARQFFSRRHRCSGYIFCERLRAIVARHSRGTNQVTPAPELHKPCVAGLNPAAATTFWLVQAKIEGFPSKKGWGSPCCTSMSTSIPPCTSEELCTSRLAFHRSQGYSPSAAVRWRTGHA